MNQSQRHERLRLLIKKLNRERKRQASQIDILCNDLVAAHRGFVKRLSGVSFAATFYKNLLGDSDLRSLLVKAGRLIREELPGTSVTFFLRHPEGYRLYAVDSHEACPVEDQPLEGFFNSELADNICKSNRVCTLEEMFGMGLKGDLPELGSMSAAALPLNDLGRSLGFLLLYRPMSHPLKREELHKVSLVTCGLSHAIKGCRLPLHCGE
ncbi:MAG: hypothetical protein ACYTAS_04915 [Planctomycetota bacterium]|jgi:hypothetical protein